MLEISYIAFYFLELDFLKDMMRNSDLDKIEFEIRKDKEPNSKMSSDKTWGYVTKRINE